MKKNKLLLATIALVTSSFIFISCKKDKYSLPAVETYRLLGRIDPSRTTIASAVLTKAEFTVSFNNANSFGDVQSLISGNLTMTGFTLPVDTITTRTPIANTNPRDTTVVRTFFSSTFDLFSTQSSGPAISYITVPTSRTVTFRTSRPPLTSAGLFGNYSTVYYTYNNSSSASFTVNNFPLSNEITAPLKEGKGYIRMGRAPNFVFILLDNVTKL